MFECVINVSEGRDFHVIDDLCDVSGASLKDMHSDEFHNRSVFTLINDPVSLVNSVHALIATCYERLDLSTHEGVHPRFGVVDVVPFVALNAAEADQAVTLRDDVARWLVENYEVPVFLYGPLLDHSIRSLPDVRRNAFLSLMPDMGPATASNERGCVAVGARPILVAWNLWLEDVSLDDARMIAKALRQSAVRSLAFDVGDSVQVSCNIIDTDAILPSQLYDQVTSLLNSSGQINRAELVGLVPASLLEREDPVRWTQLGLARDTTIETRIVNWNG
jgi:glutamate formiminotransferase / 5-formyltetrahydrofolate cyclo-ligase